MTGLKSRLIFAFVSIIILPVALTISILIFLFYNLNDTTRVDEGQLDMLMTEVKETIREYHHTIDKPEQFYVNVKPILEKYDIELKVTSDYDQLVFDSRDFALETTEAPFWLNNKLTLYAPIDGGHPVHAELQINSFDIAPFKSLKDVTMSLMTIVSISLGSGFILLVLLMIGWTWYISRTVLQPLKTIYTATSEMMNGNLDYPIPYRKKDEIGRFIEGFNLMRHHLKESLFQQQQYEKSRKELIASISHDLRTPLSSIKGYVEGLEDGIASNEKMQKKYYRVIKTKTEQLDRLIEDLFEFSKLELNQLSIEKERVNSKEFFKDIFEDAQLDFSKTGVELILSEPVASISLMVDKDRMRQVLTNLFTNAVSYSSSQVVFSVQVVNGMLQLRVKDDGPGISKEDLPHIFDRFYRGEKSRSREHGGTGLGLAIVKYIVEAHDGEVHAVSELGNGSEFIITLPI